MCKLASWVMGLILLACIASLMQDAPAAKVTVITLGDMFYPEPITAERHSHVDWQGRVIYADVIYDDDGNEIHRYATP